MGSWSVCLGLRPLRRPVLSEDTGPISPSGSHSTTIGLGLQGWAGGVHGEWERLHALGP